MVVQRCQPWAFHDRRGFAPRFRPEGGLRRKAGLGPLTDPCPAAIRGLSDHLMAVPPKVYRVRSQRAAMTSWNCGKHRSIVGAPVAPHIVAFVSAKTVPFANIRGSRRGARIGI